MIEDSPRHSGIDKALDAVSNLTEISSSKVDVKKADVAIITMTSSIVILVVFVSCKVPIMEKVSVLHGYLKKGRKTSSENAGEIFTRRLC